MTSEWLWCAGYVSGIAQDRLTRGFIDTVSSLSKGMIEPEMETLSPYIDTGFDHAAIAPTVGDWTVLWNPSWRLCAWTFATQKLSGILCKAWTYGIVRDRGERLDTYSFSFWEDGILTDWFVYNPPEEFGGWDYTSTKDVFLPYVKAKRPETTFTWSFGGDTKEFAIRHPDLFQSRRILDYLKPNVAADEAEKILTMSKIDDVFRCTALLDLPFCSPDYGLWNYARYASTLPGFDNTHNPGQKGVTWSQDWIDAVRGFSFVGFRVPRETPQEIKGPLFYLDY